MPLKEPTWWYEPPNSWRQRALNGAGHAYGRIAQYRFEQRAPYRSKLPVICIGNFTAGGTGKTPLAIYTAARVQAKLQTPAFLSRGYGGSESGPLWVEREHHNVQLVGDEPLLLASHAPTLIAHNRRAGAQAIEADASVDSVIIMDDGLQNPGLKKDLAIAVVDGLRGLGNGSVIPAGPLRAPLDFQLGLVDAIVVNRLHLSQTASPADEDMAAAIFEQLEDRFAGPVLRATTAPDADLEWLRDKPVIAYAGIGNPARFTRMLEDLGAEVIAAFPYPDHHLYTHADAEELLTLRSRSNAQLVTTEKDLARLVNASLTSVALGRLYDETAAVPIEISFARGDGNRYDALLDDAIANGGYRGQSYRR